METVEFGRTGMRVGRVGFGGGGIGSVWGETTRTEGIEAVRRALDLGVNFFDVAPGYGSGLAEEVLGEGLGSDRAHVFVSTKFHAPPEALDDIERATRASLEQSLRRLRTDYVDVFFVHNRITASRGDWPRSITPQDALAMIEAIRTLQAEGRVRFIGITGWMCTGAAVRYVLEQGDVDAVQAEYHILNQTAQSPPPPDSYILGDVEAQRMHADEFHAIDQGQIIPTAVANGAAVVGIRPVMAGALTNSVDRPVEPGSAMYRHIQRTRALEGLREDGQGNRKTMSAAALQFVLANPDISVVIPGVKTAAEMEDAARAPEGRLSEYQLDHIERLYQVGFGVPGRG